MIEVILGDDHPLVRAGLRHVLEAEQDVHVCGEASDGREVLERVEALRPDVVVLDISMPQLSGLEALERIRSHHPGVKVVLLSVHREPPFVRSAVSLGADGYLLKDGRPEDVVDAVRAVMAGGSYFSPSVAREIVRGVRSAAAQPADPFAALSRREREVLALIAEGLSAREIGAQLGISAKTVEAHRTSIMRKLGARKATELVRYAIRHGLVEP